MPRRLVRLTHSQIPTVVFTRKMNIKGISWLTIDSHIANRMQQRLEISKKKVTIKTREFKQSMLLKSPCVRTFIKFRLLNSEAQWREVTSEYLATDVFWRTWCLWHRKSIFKEDPGAELSQLPSWKVVGWGQLMEEALPQGRDGSRSLHSVPWVGCGEPHPQGALCGLPDTLPCSLLLRASALNASPERKPWTQAPLSIGSSWALLHLALLGQLKFVDFGSGGL